MQKKPLRSAALCLLCLLLTAVPVAAQDDGYLFIRKDSRDSIVSLYVPSVEVREHYSGDYVVGWVRFIYSDATAAELAVNGVKPHHCMEFFAANTKARQVKEISWVNYDKEGKELDSDMGSFNSFAWEECIPGRNGEAIWLALMKAAGYR